LRKETSSAGMQLANAKTGSSVKCSETREAAQKAASYFAIILKLKPKTQFKTTYSET